MVKNYLGKESKYKGILLVLEGMDGSGKTTLAKALMPVLTRLFKVSPDAVELLREPGGVPESEAVRKDIMEHPDYSTQKVAELFAKSRHLLVTNKLLPDLQEGKIVILDRYYWSSVAYQGFGDELGADAVLDLNQEAISLCPPDKIYYLDLPAVAGIQRQLDNNLKQNYLDQLSSEQQDRIRKGYNYLITNSPYDTLVVDASATPEQVLKNVVNDLLEDIIQATIEEVIKTDEDV